jgi:hypothetical protein
MTTFTINEENEIVAHATVEESASRNTTPFDSFASREEFEQLAAAWPVDRLVAIWNSLSGVVPVERFQSAKTAVKRIWERIQRQRETVEGKPDAAAETRSRAKRRAPARSVAPAGRKPGKKASRAKRAPKGQKADQSKAEKREREGSKKAEVLAMLRRKEGATLTEIMEKMGWQKHTVRGFMAGAMKKSGHTVESFKPEGGARTYRVND